MYDEEFRRAVAESLDAFNEKLSAQTELLRELCDRQEQLQIVLGFLDLRAQPCEPLWPSVLRATRQLRIQRLETQRETTAANISP
jgi:hypothetical protein